MDCGQLVFSGHAIRPKFARGISAMDVQAVVARGKIIRASPDDMPYPSSLILSYVDGRPIHAAVARNPSDEKCIVMTVYEPDPALWTADFEHRRTT